MNDLAETVCMNTSIDTATIAKFNPLIRPYLVVTIGFSMAITIIGLPLALIWFLGAGQWWARHYFNKLECHLGEKTLRYRKGILVQVEKTIPLENIQDVTFIEGPILRYFHLSTLKFETAGHSAGQANNMHLTGIMEAHEFRNRIFEARDALKQKNYQPHVTDVATSQTNDLATGQLAALQSIDRRLDEIISLMKERK
jgi:membrane protein YdbS with pleckstrin-like domain